MLITRAALIAYFTKIITTIYTTGNVLLAILNNMYIIKSLKIYFVLSS